MIEYSERFDEQISDALRRRGRVTVDGLAGLSEEDGAALLRRYAEVHAAEAVLAFDGRELTWAVAPAAGSTGARAAEIRPSATLSPVDQVLAAPTGRSLLDTAPTGPRVNRAFWLLPLSFGLPGGLLAWLVVRGDNPRVAKSLLITGAVVQLSSMLLGLAVVPMLGSFVSRSQSTGASVTWAASSTGRPEFHYFGTAT